MTPKTIFAINLSKDQTTSQLEKDACLSITLYKVNAADDVEGLLHDGKTTLVTACVGTTSLDENFKQLSVIDGVDVLITGLRNLADNIERYRDA